MNTDEAESRYGDCILFNIWFLSSGYLGKEKQMYPCGHRRNLSVTDVGEVRFYHRDVR